MKSAHTASTAFILALLLFAGTASDASAQTRYEFRRVTSGLQVGAGGPASPPTPSAEVQLQPAGYRTWSDGTVAESCLAYRAASSGKNYSGDVGDGLYRVQPAGFPATNVHCDMSTDGGGWTLVARVQAGTNAHVDANAVGVLNSPAQVAAAKLSDAYINALANPTTGLMRLTGDGAPSRLNYFKFSGVPFSAVGAAAPRPVSLSVDGAFDVATTVNGSHGGLNSYGSLSLAAYMVYGPASPADGCRIAMAGPASWCGPGGSGTLYVK